MADKDAKTRDKAGKVTGLGSAEEAASQSKEAVEEVEDEARDVARRAMLREAPYAAAGLADMVATTARRVDASSLSERLRRTPVAVASKTSNLGASAKVSYLALAARGRGARLQGAGEAAAGEAAEQAKAAVGQAEDAGAATRDAVEEGAGRTGDAAEATGGRAKALFGKVRSAASRSPKASEEHADDTEPSDDTEPATADPEPAADEPENAMDTGKGPLERRTVAQLRNHARELGIEEDEGMSKKELVRAIRDAS